MPPSVDDAGWEAEPAPRSPLRTGLNLLGGIAVVAAVAWLVSGPSTQVVPDPAPSPDVLVVESTDPTPTPTAQPLTFLGVPLVASPEQVDDVLHEVVLRQGTVGFQVPSLEPAPPWPAVVFTCDGRTTRITFARPAETTAPAQLLFAAAAEEASARGCPLQVPDGAIAGTGLQTWAVELLAALHRAGYAAEFATPSARLAMTLHRPSDEAIDAVVGARPTSSGGEAFVDPALPSAGGQPVALASGTAIDDDGRLFFRCDPRAILDVRADAPGLEALLAAIDCVPAPPPDASPSPGPAAEGVPALVDRLVAAGVDASGVVDGGVVVAGGGPASFALRTVEGRVRVVVRADDGDTALAHVPGVRDQLVRIADGEGLMSAAGTLRMTCGPRFLAVNAPIDPALAAFELIASVEGCTPSPTPTLVGDTVRASRLDQVRRRLGLETCCGDPDRQGDAGSVVAAVRYGDRDVALRAVEPERSALAVGGTVAPVGPGEALVQGDGAVVFACGDSDYRIEGADGAAVDPPLTGLAEQVVTVLGCRPATDR